MLLPLLFIATQLTTMQFSATNMQCWATSNFFQSQPLAMNVEIPANATQVMLSTGAGRSDYSGYSLRNCPSYNSCTNFGYYISTCPTITTLGFGTSNLTSILRPGSYRLTLDSINPYGYGSTEITNVVLDVSIPVLIFNATDKQCTYNSSETRCSANVSAVGTGQCFYPTTALNAPVFKAGETTPVSSSSNSGRIYWNCTTGNYSIDFTYLPISSSQTWSFADSNLTSQHLLSTLQVTNPNADNFTDVPFVFTFNSITSGFDMENSEVNGTTSLYSLQSKNLTALFSANVIRIISPLSTSPIYFNFFTPSLLLANASVENNFSIPFTFSTADLPLGAFNCTENNFAIPAGSQAAFSISCSPQVNYSFSNWAGHSATAASTTLTLSSPANQSIFVSGISQKLSEVFAMPVSAEQDNFTYAGTTNINLTGEFVSISVQNESRIDKDKLNYSLKLNDRALFLFNATVELDFSGYLNVSFSNGAIPPCPALICLDNLILKVAVLNQTNFSILAFKPVQVEQHVVSVSGSPTSNGQRGGGGGLPSYATEEADQPEPIEENGLQISNYSDPAKNEKSNVQAYIPQEANALPNIGEATHNSPLSGFLIAFPQLAIFALPFLLLACGASMLLLRKPKLVSRVVRNGKTIITTFNSNEVPMQNLEVREVLPLETTVSGQACQVEESIIGKVLTWKKAELKKGEKWAVQYTANAGAKRGKLLFVRSGKKYDVLF